MATIKVDGVIPPKYTNGEEVKAVYLLAQMDSVGGFVSVAACAVIGKPNLTIEECNILEKFNQEYIQDLYENALKQAAYEVKEAA